MSWSKPSSVKTLGFLSNEAIKVCVSRLWSRCIVALTLNNYIYNLLLRFVSGFLVQIINQIVAKLFSVFKDKCIFKMTTLILKLQSD